jgi:uncharacterized protein YjbI with pentapeptide repeats
MPNQGNDQERKAAAPLARPVLVLLLFYIAVTVAGHADTDLIRPDTQVSLEAAAQKVSLPSGWIFTPFLGLKLPIFWFYVLAPVLVLALHFELLNVRAAGEWWDTALLLAGNLLAPLALFLLLWKFAPYGRSRPPDLSGIQAAVLLSFAHAGALIADSALLIYASLETSAKFPEGMPARVAMRRRMGLALMAARNAGLLGMTALALAAVVKAIADLPEVPKDIVRRFFGISDMTLVIAIAVMLAGAITAAPALMRYVRRLAGIPPRIGQTDTLKEAAPMPIFFSLFVALLVGVALPDVGRALNLTGAKLTAAEPSDIIVAAVMATTNGRDVAVEGGDNKKSVEERAREAWDRARARVWQYFGRGLDYSHWRFNGGSFDGASMSLVHLVAADLSDASFIRAELTGAWLIGARLDRTVLADANLSFADLSCVNAAVCDLGAQGQIILAQAERPNPPATTQASPAATAARDGLACRQAKTGPKLDNANLTGARLNKANLSNASLRGATIVGVKDAAELDLTNACLCGANLRDTDLSSAKLAGASLRAADLTGAKLPRDLHEIDLEGANLKGTQFTDNSDLHDGNLTGVVQTEDFKPSCPLPP